MRARKEIQNDFWNAANEFDWEKRIPMMATEGLLEVMLDCRDLLIMLIQAQNPPTGQKTEEASD